jgi:hypothetical protein
MRAFATNYQAQQEQFFRSGFSGGRMPNKYSVSRCGSGWAISVDGAILMICERKAVAQQIVRDAKARELRRCSQSQQWP